MLKRILSALLIALMLTFVFVSCSKDDTQPPDDGNGENNGDNTEGGNENKPTEEEKAELEFTLKSDGTYLV